MMPPENPDRIGTSDDNLHHSNGRGSRLEPVESYDLETAGARATRLAGACVIFIAIITSDRKSRWIPIERLLFFSSPIHSSLIFVILAFYLLIRMLEF